MIKSLDDYVDVMVAKAKSRGYRVSRRCAKKLIQAHFEQLYKRLGQKHDVYINDFILFIFRKERYYRLRDEEYALKREAELSIFLEPGEEVEE